MRRLNVELRYVSFRLFHAIIVTISFSAGNALYVKDDIIARISICHS